MASTSSDILRNALALPGIRLSRDSLRHRVMRSSAWTAFEYGGSQALRFGGNLALTYLLVPKAFGLMAVVNVCVQGLEMFSDVGIAPSIIQSYRGGDRRFLDTAWTVQVIRGFVLWAIACFLAWPMSVIYNDALMHLMPVAALTLVLRGFNSTKWFTQNRQLTLGRRTLIRIGSQAAMVVVMIAWAWQVPTIWALIAGTLTGAAIEMLSSHLVLTGGKNRLHFEREALLELYRFGRWIAISTALTFGAKHIETLLFGKLFGESALGVFWIALQIARFGPEFMQKLGQHVAFPALAELFRQDISRFYRRMLHLRTITILPLNLAMMGVILLGPLLVQTIYPSDYGRAGWMVATMATAALASMVNDGYGNAYLAMGRSHYVMTVVGAQIVISLACCLTGYYVADGVGFIVGLAFVHWFVYPVNILIARRAGIWQPQLDLPVLAVFGAAGFTMLMMRLV
jgi:O-antigen/teichoic acid export membrane protein